MKITSKGQVTIPQEYRERYGFLPDTEVEFVSAGKSLKLVKSTQKSFHGRRLVEHMRGKGDGYLSTDEIMSFTRGEH